VGVADPSAYYPAAKAGDAPARPRPALERDPLGAVFSLGDRAARIGLVLGVLVALLTHGGAAVRAMTSLFEMRAVTRAMQVSLHEFFWSRYDIEVDKPKPVERKEEPPPPAPDPEPEPIAKAAPPPPKDPYDAPPAPAKAGKILTAPEKADDPEDLTDRGIVSGDGTGPGYGQVSAAGTATAPTYNPNAQVGGKPGGTGTGPVSTAPPAVAGPDRSKPPGIVGGTDWNCPFPPEADADQVDFAVASIVVTVRPDGTPQSVKVVSDPGHGFGRAARMCALGRRYTPGNDRAGQPITGTTPPIKVRFTR
jgi:protein TonB